MYNAKTSVQTLLSASLAHFILILGDLNSYFDHNVLLSGHNLAPEWKKYDTYDQTKILIVHFVPKMPKHGSVHADLLRCWNEIRVTFAFPKGAENGLKKGVLVPWSQYYTFAPHIFWWNECVWPVCSYEPSYMPFVSTLKAHFTLKTAISYLVAGCVFSRNPQIK